MVVGAGMGRVVAGGSGGRQVVEGWFLPSSSFLEVIFCGDAIDIVFIPPLRLPSPERRQQESIFLFRL